MNKKLNFKKLSRHESPERSPGFLLWHVSISWRSSIETALKPLGLTHPQFVILATLGWLTKDGQHTTQGAVGKLAGLDPNTTSQIARGLEQKKLIKRLPSLDGRAKNPFLTVKGKKILAQALPIVENADAHFFLNLTDQEMHHALKLFQKLTYI